MNYAMSSYSKGFFVNTSAIAAQSLDVSRDSKAERILTVAIKEERAKSAYKKAIKEIATSDEALLKSLEDGSFFSRQSTPSYIGSSYNGNSYNGGYSGGSYGQFISSTESADEDDLARYGLGSQETPRNSDSAYQADENTENHAFLAPAQTSTLDKIKGFLLKYKLYLLLGLVVAIVVAFRKK